MRGFEVLTARAFECERGFRDIDVLRTDVIAAVTPLARHCPTTFRFVCRCRPNEHHVSRDRRSLDY